MLPTINILDPGLINHVGHHFDLDLKICKALQKLGFDVHIYGTVKAQKKLTDTFNQYGTYHPIFTASPYINIDMIDPIAGGYIAFTQHSNILKQELKQIITEGDWIFPTFLAAHLNACAMLKVDKKIWGILQLPIESQYAQDDVFWRYSFINASANCPKLNVGVIEPELFFEFQRVAGDRFKINILPIPYECSTQATRNEEMKVIGFFGHQRNEKGAIKLNQLALHLANKNYSVILHNCHDSNADQRHPNIVNIGFVDDLSLLINQCDCVVLPYQMKQYRTKGSGILYDALAAGIPVIAPSDTSMARWIQKSMSGELFYEQNSTSIFNAVDKVSRNYSDFLDHANLFKKSWVFNYGIDKLAIKLIS